MLIKANCKSIRKKERVRNTVAFCESNGSAGTHPTANHFKRNNSRYGVPIDSSAVKLVYRVRSERLSNRVKITDRALVLAMLGIFVMVVDAEITGQSMFGITKVGFTDTFSEN
ncbi:hypothetical protein ANCDUO_26858 [Ancylostoma duodenale]|uniref:Uncharacterized protein n=1 Tax=Ancylostoma duodenale TaxID=51022 RepID=A0A0C2BH85_9BILA|nr:hypothetical protein ANCDUO_26858 [Ancylostoma duodenale]